MQKNLYKYKSKIKYVLEPVHIQQGVRKSYA